MLPRAARLTSGRDFSETVRSGRRAGARRLVVHLDLGDGNAAGPSRAGLVVPRAVGSAVTRNRVKRRLRHLLADRLEELPAASRVVVRALPAAATASSQALDHDLRGAVSRAQGRSSAGGGRS